MKLTPYQITALADRIRSVVFDSSVQEESITITPIEQDTIVAALHVAASLVEIANLVERS